MTCKSGMLLEKRGNSRGECVVEVRLRQEVVGDGVKGR